MNYLPTLRFTLVADQQVVAFAPIGTGWATAAMEWGGTLWVNTPNGSQVTGAGRSGMLYFPFTKQVNKFVEVELNVNVITKSKITVCFFKQVPLSPYITLKNLYTVELAAGQIYNRRFFHKMFDGDYDAIGIYVDNAPGVPYNVVLSYFDADIKGALNIPISPGNFKTVTSQLIRSPEFYGINDLLGGSIELHGEELREVVGLLIIDPSRIIECLVEISDDQNAWTTIGQVLVDTSSLDALINKDIYSGTLIFLKESSWTQFLANYDKKLDLGICQDMLGFDTLDASGMEQIINPPNTTDLGCVFTQVFEANILMTNIKIAGDQTMYVGFGADVIINEEFRTFSQLSQDVSVKLNSDLAELISLVGEVKLVYSLGGGGGGVNVTVMNLQDSWVPLVTNVAQSINLTPTTPEGTVGESGGWGIRITNTNNNEKSFTVAPGSYVRFSAKVRYRFNPFGMTVHSVLRAFTDRLLNNFGDGNLSAPMFKSYNFNGFAQIFSSGVPNNNPFFNPPPLNSQENKPGERLVGNLWDGYNAVSWTYVPATDTADFSTPGGAINKSNPLLIRAISTFSGKTYSTYLSPGSYEIVITVSIAVPTFILEGYWRGKVVQTIYSGPLAAGVNNINVISNEELDGIGLVMQGAPNVPLLGNVSTFSFNLLRPQPEAIGKYSDNMICRGTDIRFNPATSIYVKKYKESPLSTDYRSILVSLCTIFGLGLSQRGKRLALRELDNHYRPVFNAYTFKAVTGRYFTDPEVIFGSTNVGGLYDNSPIAAKASCGQSEYVSNYSSVNRTNERSFDMCLNSYMIVAGELDREDTFLVNLSEVYNASVGSSNRYRLDNGITVENTDNPKQVNWIHSEGRLMLRNKDVFLRGQSRYLRLIYSTEGNAVKVTYADGFGTVSDQNLVFGNGYHSPFCVEFETGMTWQDYFTVRSDPYDKFNVQIGSFAFPVYLKEMSYNFMTAKAFVQAWIITQ
jgi:hypothetical protein